MTIQRKGKIFRKKFSDGLFGGKRNALKEAKAYRDSILEAHLPMTRVKYAQMRRKNNRSGVPGVCRHVATELRDGKTVEHAYWIAFWPPGPDGRGGRKKFSVSRHGETKAFARAVQARKQGLKNLHGLFIRTPALRTWLKSHGYRDLVIE